MSWKDRAIAVDATAPDEVQAPAEASAGSWKDRAQVVPKESIGDKVEELAGNVGQNALDIINPVNIVKGVADTAKQGLLDIPKDLIRSSVDVVKSGARALMGKETVQDVGKDIVNTPIVQRTKAMTEPIAKDPAGFAFKRPLDAASLLLAPILPFLGEGAATKAASMAESAPTTAEAVAPGFARRMTAKTISATLGAPEDAVLSRMENPAATKTAFTHPELADQMVNSVKTLRDTVGELDTKAYDTLSTSPFIETTKNDPGRAIPKTVIADAIKSSRRDLGGIFSQESEAAAGALKNVVDYYKKLRNTVSETQVKDLIQQLDSDINWGDPSASRTNEALVGVRTRLDGVLKRQNPAYAKAMEPVTEASRLMDEMQKKFGIQRKTGEGLSVTDQTVNKIKGALKEDRLGTQNILSRFQKLTGEDFESKIKNANVAAAFDGATTNGSRRAVLGTALGGAAGYVTGVPPWITSAIGSVGGAFADIYGRRVAGALADALSVPEMRRYVPILKKAASRGSKALAMTHARLIESDPNYTAAMAQAIHGKLSTGNDTRPSQSRK